MSVSLGPDGLCRECTNFAPTEHIVYATAELLSIEFENGILAMEFAAPEAGEVILQLARRPTRSVPRRGQAHRLRLGRAAHARPPQDPRRHPAGQPRAHRHRHRSAGHLGFLQRPPSPGDRAQESGLHHVLFGRGRRTLPPAPARRLHGDSRKQIAQRNRLRNHDPRGRHPRRLCQPRPRGRWCSARPGARTTLPARLHPPALRHAVSLWPADGNDSGAADRRRRSQGRRQSGNLDSQ